MESCVRGHHVYQHVWTLLMLGEELQCACEESNDSDPYTVAVMNRHNVVGHVPRRISAACSIFLCKRGMIVCTVTAPRRFSADLPQGGLEIPCTLRFTGESQYIWKVKKLSSSANANSCSRTTQSEQPDEENQPVKKAAKFDNNIINVDDFNIQDYSAPELSFDSYELSMEDRLIINSGGKGCMLVFTESQVLNFSQLLQIL